MIELNEETSRKLRNMLPTTVGRSIIVDSKSVYLPDGDVRAFLVIRRDAVDRISIFHFDISRNAKMLREDFVIHTSPNATRFYIADHEQNFSTTENPQCGDMVFYRCNQMEVKGKPFDDGVCVTPEESLCEFEIVVNNAWEHQQKLGRAAGAS